MSVFDQLSKMLERWGMSTRDLVKYIGQESWDDPDITDDYDQQDWDDFIDSFETVEIGPHYDGQDFDVIFKWQNTYFRGTGCYSSWGSTDFSDEIEEVVPVSETIIVYKTKEN